MQPNLDFSHFLVQIFRVKKLFLLLLARGKFGLPEIYYCGSSGHFQLLRLSKKQLLSTRIGNVLKQVFVCHLLFLLQIFSQDFSSTLLIQLTIMRWPHFKSMHYFGFMIILAGYVKLMFLSLKLKILLVIVSWWKILRVFSSFRILERRWLTGDCWNFNSTSLFTIYDKISSF